MRTRRHRPGAAPRRATCAFGVALLLTLLVVGTPGIAAAHELIDSVPATGTLVDEPLSSVELFFTEPPVAMRLEMRAPDGTRVDAGWHHGDRRELDEPFQELVIENDQRTFRDVTSLATVVLEVSHLPEQGDYVVGYRSTAQDGDEVAGAIAFTYTGDTTAPPDGWQPPTRPAPQTDGPLAEQADSGERIRLAALVAGAALVVLLLAVVAVRRRRAQPAPPPPTRATRAGSASSRDRRSPASPGRKKARRKATAGRR